MLSLDCPVQKGSSVRIDCGVCEFRGRVTGCTHWPAINGYMAQIAFEEPWEPTAFKPDRLFNPNFLICGNAGCTPECVNECCLPSEDGESGDIDDE